MQEDFLAKVGVASSSGASSKIREPPLLRQSPSEQVDALRVKFE
jgi:hypothetical protein